jgi:hypothetical protein
VQGKLVPEDPDRQGHAALLLFGRNIEERVRATSDRSQLELAISEAKVRPTAPAGRPAVHPEPAAAVGPSARKEAVLISDFRRPDGKSTRRFICRRARR